MENVEIQVHIHLLYHPLIWAIWIQLIILIFEVFYKCAMGLFLCLAAVAALVDDLPPTAGTIELRSGSIPSVMSSTTSPEYAQTPFMSINDDSRAVRGGDGIYMS